MMAHSWLNTIKPDSSPGRMPRNSRKCATVKADFLYDFCKNDMLDNMGDGQWVDSAPWGAEQAYYACRTDSATPIRYLLWYPNRIVELRMDWTPTPEQMAIIAAAFG